MACGYGACFGCVVPTRARLRARVRRRPGARCGAARQRAGPGPRVTAAGVVSAGAPRPVAELPLEFCGLRLAHPIINASGTFDLPAAARTFDDALFDPFPFAAFVSKTITLAPRAGNPPPRLWETPAGMINSIGLPNRGLDGYLRRPAGAGAPARRREALPPGRRRRRAVPLITNVMGSTGEELAALVEPLDGRPEVAALELNVSCPNVRPALTWAPTRASSSARLRCVRPRTAKPLIVKLTPNAADVARGGRGRRGGGRRRRLADQHAARDGARPRRLASLAGRAHGRSVGPGGARGGPRPGGGGRRARRHPGGRAWAAFRPLAMHTSCSRCGAMVVAVGTESFRDPAAGARIARDVQAILANSGFSPGLGAGLVGAKIPAKPQRKPST